MKQLKAVFKYLLFHKKKIGLAHLLILFFLLVLFPFEDLSDLVSMQISNATDRQLFVQFENMELSIFPNMGLGLEKLTVETPTIGPISADRIVVLPSIRGLIFQEPAGKLTAKGLLNGNIEIDLSNGRKTESGLPTSDLSIEGKSISLGEVKKLAPLPVSFKGSADFFTKGNVELTFKEQPDFELEMKVDKFEMPPSTFDTMMGPLSLPDLKVSLLEVKGRLSAGKFQIEKAALGKPTDEVFGSVKGGINIAIQNRGGIFPVIGSYNFEIDLTVKPTFEQKFKTFLVFIENFKSTTAGGTRYAFKISATSPEMPPNMTAIK